MELFAHEEQLVHIYDLCACPCYPVEGDILAAGDVVHLLARLGVAEDLDEGRRQILLQNQAQDSTEDGFYDIQPDSSNSPHACQCTDLDMAELGDLVPSVRDGDRATSLEPVEEPLLHGVVVERAVDVDRSDGRPVHAARLQQALCLQLSLMPAFWVHNVGLPVGWAYACHESVMVTTSC